MEDVLTPHTNEVASTIVQRMDPDKEKSTWWNGTAKKSETLISGQDRLAYSQDFDMANDEIQSIRQHATFARERHSDKFGNGAWNETESAFAHAKNRHQRIQQLRRRREQDIAALDGQIDMAWEGVSKGSGTQKIARLRQLQDTYEKQDEIKSTLESIPFMDPGSASQHHMAGFHSSQRTRTEDKMSETARSVSHLLNTTHQTTSSDKARNHFGSGLPVQRKAPSGNLKSYIPLAKRDISTPTSLQSTNFSSNGDAGAPSVHPLPR